MSGWSGAIPVVAGGSAFVLGDRIARRSGDRARAQTRVGTRVGAGRASGWRAPGPGRSRPAARVGGAVAAGWVGLALLGAPLVGGIALVVAAVVRMGLVARRRAARERARAEAVPELVDLFSVAVSAGLPIATALPILAGRSPPAVAPAVHGAARHLELGGSVADALGRLGRELGPAGADLVGVLTSRARTGSPLGPALRAVAATARDARLRAAQERARRLPVTLLFPLVCCTLPAAVLLAVVPVLVSSLGSLAH